MKTNFKFRVVALCFLISSASFANDIDMHFYGTYIALRWRGINHAVASYLATNSQWVDVSSATSAMGAPDYFGTRMRRLNHFPSTLRVTTASSGHGVGGITLFGRAEPNHPMASMNIAEGMRFGRLWQVGAGLHVLVDSFGHAGYSFFFGHAEGGHNPDRFFLEPKKFKVMIHRLFTAINATAMLLPENAFDPDFVKNNDPRMKMSSFDLADSFLNEPEIKDLIETNFLEHREYVKNAVDFAMEKFKDSGYFMEGIDVKSLIPKEIEFYHGKSVLEALSEIFEAIAMTQRKAVTDAGGKNLLDVAATKAVLSKGTQSSAIILNIPKIVPDAAPGLPLGLVPIEKIAENMMLEAQILDEANPEVHRPENLDGHVDIAMKIIIEKMINHVLEGEIPTKFTTINKSLFEHEGSVRKKEMDLRVGAFQDLIYSKFGVRPEFSRKAISPKTGTEPIEPISLSQPQPQIDQPESLPTEFVTMDYLTQVRFYGRMAIHNLQFWRYHHPENWYTLYQYPQEFQKAIDNGFFQPLASTKQIDKMNKEDAAKNPAREPIYTPVTPGLRLQPPAQRAALNSIPGRISCPLALAK